ncbi:MAG: C-GCAxxG-C-C family protein [Chloroflexota bacterium]|nr:C-GCAxxG-C-C family protein [Chloroflexota bacterium]
MDCKDRNMTREKFVKDRVHEYYWKDDINCATTTLKVLSEAFAIELNEQVMDSAIGMHGAGEFGAQCGLVEGTLMFLGIAGRAKGTLDENVVKSCQNFARQFEMRFGSLQCRVLRPQGFKPDNPPHLCEEITREGIVFSIEFVSNVFGTRCIL